MSDYGERPTNIINFLNQSQYWSREWIENYQIEHLNNLLQQAVEGSPFYHEYYHNHMITLDHVSDMRKLPFITKDIIREHAQRMMIQRTKERSFERTTSGSTGDPLTVQIGKLAQVFRKAGECRFYDWWGIRPYDRNILIWARKATSMQPGRINALKRIKSTLRSNTIERTLFIDVFGLNTSSTRKYFKESIEFKPTYLRGYMSGVLQFAELMSEAGLDASRLNLKVVIVTSEMLSDDQRRYIENAFACPVANEYGSADAGLFAFDCPQKRMHVFEEAVLLAPLADGKLSVTEYHNTLMPLINYMNNDSISLSDEPCRCGRSLMVIDEIQGRISDFVLTAHGDKLSSKLFSYAFNELNDTGLNLCVKKYKVIQRGMILDIFIVKDIAYRDEVLIYLEHRIKNVLGKEIEIRFHFVNEIEREKSGKLRYFIQQTEEAVKF